MKTEENSVKENEELTPSKYFQILKSKKNKVTDLTLCKIYDNCLTLLNKYKITGQTKGMRKLIFHLETIEKEKEIVKLGIDTFIYRDDIEEYIDVIKNDAVKIIELENYEREIPDEIVDVVEKVKDKFSKLYVLFTDYTGKTERHVTKERQERDPILFGTLQNKETKTTIDRFYFLGDWVDEYCDLTLDKMVNEVKDKKNKTITRTISTPKDIEDLKEQLKHLQETEEAYRMDSKFRKKSVFNKIRTFLSRR